jgi:hypothetical protein
VEIADIVQVTAFEGFNCKPREVILEGIPEVIILEVVDPILQGFATDVFSHVRGSDRAVL